MMCSDTEVEDAKEVKEIKDVKRCTPQIAPIRKYGDLLVYKQAYRLALDISKFTKSLPREEQFELGRQLRRSARSVPGEHCRGLDKTEFGAGIQAPLVNRSR